MFSFERVSKSNKKRSSYNLCVCATLIGIRARLAFSKINFNWYLINRIATKALEDKTPYESLYVKKPNIEHLRVFGCVAFAKINSPHLKKLDDRSRMVINLGTEPGSKAYRLYDPVTKKIVVSRDVIFDEKKS